MMIEVYSRGTSEVIRYDFIRFARPDTTKKKRIETDPKFEEKVRESLEDLRSEMANDDGLGSYGSYKCPIF